MEQQFAESAVRAMGSAPERDFATSEGAGFVITAFIYYSTNIRSYFSNPQASFFDGGDGFDASLTMARTSIVPLLGGHQTS